MLKQTTARVAVALIAVAAVPAGHAQDSQPVSKETVAGWLNSHINETDLSKRSGPAIKWNSPGLDTAEGATCHQRPKGVSAERRREIEHSAAFQRVEAHCIRFEPRVLKKVIALGLVKQHKPSPGIVNFTMTDAGKKHIQPLGNGRFQAVYGATGLENVLSVEQKTNPYGVPVVDVTYTTAPQVLDWAKPYTGKGKTLYLGRTVSTKHTAQFWQTDDGWKLFYSYKS